MQQSTHKNTKFFSSTLKRTIVTAGAVDIGIKPVALKKLDEINAGDFDGMTYAEIEERYPSDAQERKHDKLIHEY